MDFIAYNSDDQEGHSKISNDPRKKFDLKEAVKC